MKNPTNNWLENNDTTQEHGESSALFCSICYDKKNKTQFFSIEGCKHLFCKSCIKNYISVELKEINNTTSIKCPNKYCDSKIGPQHCKGLIPRQVIERWVNVLRELEILSSLEFKCPFENCSTLLTMMIDEDGKQRACECPSCCRLFCARCRAPWHGGFTCETRRKFNWINRFRGDVNGTPSNSTTSDLSKKRKWRGCQRCGSLVVRKRGCQEISCRCGHLFCYECGKEWHYGHKCHRTNDEKTRSGIWLQRPWSHCTGTAKRSALSRRRNTSVEFENVLQWIIVIVFVLFFSPSLLRI